MKLSEREQKMEDEKKKILERFNPLYWDISWLEDSFSIGKEVFRGEFYTVNEYFFDGERIGYCYWNYKKEGIR